MSNTPQLSPYAASMMNHPDNGADINTKNKDGYTALDLARDKGHTEIVELLKKHGAKE